MSVSNSQVFPMKFCAHRWLENVPVAERALQLWTTLKVYVAPVESKTVKNPSTSSFDTVKHHVGDNLTLVKLACFISISQVVTPFLAKYQSDQPLLPFLANGMFLLLCNLMQRYMKSDLFTGISEVRLMALDLVDAMLFACKSRNYC